MLLYLHQTPQQVAEESLVIALEIHKLSLCEVLPIALAILLHDLSFEVRNLQNRIYRKVVRNSPTLGQKL
jgi:hypothetical protein